MRSNSGVQRYAKPLFVILLLAIITLLGLLFSINSGSPEDTATTQAGSSETGGETAPQESQGTPGSTSEEAPSNDSLGEAIPAEEVANDRNRPDGIPEDQGVTTRGGIEMIPEPEKLQDGAGNDDEGKFGPKDQSPGIENPTEVLTPTATARVEAALLNYVIFAYGYTGGPGNKAGDVYMTGVLDAVAPDFFKDQSPGSAAVEQFRETVIQQGTKSTAYMDDFEIEEAAEQLVTGTLYFHVETPAGTQDYQQVVTVKDYFNRWQVLSAEELKEVSE